MGLVFFIIFIVITTFMVLNLFIGVVVNAMQAEAIKAEAEREAEREIIQEEAAPILAEEAAAQGAAEMRKELAAR